MLEYEKERTDLQPFPARQRRKMAIDVVGQMRVDTLDGKPPTSREQDLRSRTNETRLASM
jgi:hypothetical protein